MQTLPDLTTKALGHTLVHLEQVDSTNKYARLAAHTLPDLAVVLADSQTQGKGRAGRSWESAPGDGLYMSVLLKQLPPEHLSRLPLTAALGVCAGLGQLCGKRFDIKWPNDVLFEGGKLCGVLCESQLNAQSSVATLGIGVNLRQTREALDGLGLVYATSLFLATNKHFSAKMVAAAICNALETALERISRPVLWEEYRQRCVTLGKQVKILRAGSETPARAVDIAPDGSLLCEIDGQVVPVSAGDVSVRGLGGYSVDS